MAKLHRRRSSSGVGWGYVACALSGPYQAAALFNSACASSNSSCHGQADAIAILIRRTLTQTKAPSFSSFSRIVPQVASANWVNAGPMRRTLRANDDETPAPREFRLEGAEGSP